MKNGYILSIDTEVPKFAIPQKDAFSKMQALFSFNEEKKELVRKLYENSGIETRYTVCEDYYKQMPNGNFLGSNFPKSVPGMSQRNHIYKEEAHRLAHNAADKAIKAWGGDPSSITHIISVSCTGVVIPGIEFSLISSLNLPRSVHRLGINFMGCFGAFKGLEVANAFAQNNPKNRILLVCTELCSLHIQGDESHDTLLANSIFADGAAAAVIGSQPQPHESHLWEIVKHKSTGLDNSTELMRWEASDHGFIMKLSNYVPVTLSRHIHTFANELISPHTTIEACDWPIHPGGKTILQTIERKLNLQESQTKASRDTLRDFGNMSSATFLFVLKTLSQQPSQSKWAAGVGFGPGLSVEGILLRKDE